MKHMVRIQVTPNAGIDNEARPGGPEPIIRRILERFKPETVYMSPARREVYMVCNIDAADMAEMMLVGCRFSGQHPEFIPVIEGKEFGAIVGKALSAGKKLFEG